MSSGGIKHFAGPRVGGIETSVDVEPILDGTADLPSIADEITEPHLLSFTPMEMSRRQLRLWLQHALHKSSAALERILTLDFHGPIDPVRFERAWCTTLECTPVLRLVVAEPDGDPEPSVRSDVTPPLIIDNLDPADWDTDLARRLAEPLALDRAAYRAVLYLGTGRARFGLRVHSIAADLWSLRPLMARVARAYRGRTLGLDEHFQRFLDRERIYRASPASSDDAAFWSGRLDLPFEPPRFYGRAATHDQHAVVRHRITFPSDALDGLRDLADQTHQPSGLERAPRSLPLLATATIAYLARVTDDETIGLGVPIDMRDEDAVGPMTELCPIRVDVSSDDTFRTLLRKVQADLQQTAPRARNSIDNRFGGMTYDAVVDVVDLRLDPFGEIGVTATIESALQGDASARGERDFASFVVQFGRARGGALNVQFELAQDAFDPATINRVVSHFERIVAAMVEDIEQPIHAVPLLTDDERDELAPVVEPEPPNVSAIATILARAEEAPDRAAVITKDQSLDYQTLVDRARGLARFLRTRLDVAPGDRVALCLERSTDLIVAILGTHLAGAAFVPLDPTHPRARTARILEDAAPTVLLTQSQFVSQLMPPPNTRVACLDADRDAIPDAGDGASSPAPDQMAYVIYTSGSTGDPKGVRIDHAALTNLLEAMTEHDLVAPGGRLLAVTTVSFDIAILELLLPLYVGGTVVLADEATTADPPQLAAWIEEHRIDTMQATPATWRSLVDSGWTGRSDLTIVTGGEALPPDLAARLLTCGRVVWNVYGPTETTIWSSAHRVEPKDTAGPIPIGSPIRSTEMYIRSPHGFLEPGGVVGELCIGGAGLARGYHQRPDLDRAAFVPHPFAPDRRIYRTGDLARRRPDGTFDCLGRLDDQVKVRGFRIELGEIERAIRQHPQINDAAVVVREDRPGDRRIVAYVVADGGGLVPFASSLREYLGGTLPAYMVPASFVVLSALPLTPNGKVDRRALRTPTMPSRTSRIRVRPRNDLELQILDIWREVLGTNDLGVTDPFFALGGHSLHAVSMLSLLRKRLGAQIPVAEFFRTPNIAALAELVAARSKRAHQASVIALERGGDQTPLFCVCGLHLYQELAIALGDKRAVYGVLSPAEIDFLDAANPNSLPDVPALASQYVDAILDARPEGPYAIAGISFGGLLAFEAARQLVERGKVVTSVVVLDAVLEQAIRHGARRWVANRVHGLLRRGRDKLRREIDPTDALERLRAKTYDERALQYERIIAPYDGNVVVVRARDHHEGYDVDADLGWRRHVRGRLDIHEVPGDHLGILDAPNATALARTIAPYLDGPG